MASLMPLCLTPNVAIASRYCRMLHRTHEQPVLCAAVHFSAQNLFNVPNDGEKPISRSSRSMKSYLQTRRRRHERKSTHHHYRIRVFKNVFRVTWTLSTLPQSMRTENNRRCNSFFNKSDFAVPYKKKKNALKIDLLTGSERVGGVLCRR